MNKEKFHEINELALEASRIIEGLKASVQKSNLPTHNWSKAFTHCSLLIAHRSVLSIGFTAKEKLAGYRGKTK